MPAMRCKSLELGAALHQLHQAEADFHHQRIHLEQRFDVFLGRFLGAFRRGFDGGVVFPTHAPADGAQSAAQGEKRNGGQSGEQRKRHQHAAGEQQRFRFAEHLGLELRSQLGVRTGARDDQAARDGDHQRWNHGHQTVADGEHGVGLDGVAEIHVVLQDADQKAGHDIHAGDDDAGDGIALREAGGAVHGSVELGLAAQIAAAAARFGFIDQPAVQIRVDGHLLAGQGVQSEARGDFGNAHRSVVDDDVLNGDQHAENHRADDVVAAHHEAAESFDDMAGRGSSGISIEQNEARRRHVERQTEKRQQQQHGGEDAELHRPADVHGHHHHDDRHHEIQHDQDVQHEAGQRGDERDDDQQYRDGYREFADIRKANGES